VQRNVKILDLRTYNYIRDECYLVQEDRTGSQELCEGSSSNPYFHRLDLIHVIMIFRSLHSGVHHISGFRDVRQSIPEYFVFVVFAGYSTALVMNESIESALIAVASGLYDLSTTMVWKYKLIETEFWTKKYED